MIWVIVLIVVLLIYIFDRKITQRFDWVINNRGKISQRERVDVSGYLDRFAAEYSISHNRIAEVWDDTAQLLKVSPDLMRPGDTLSDYCKTPKEISSAGMFFGLLDDLEDHLVYHKIESSEWASIVTIEDLVIAVCQSGQEIQ